MKKSRLGTLITVICLPEHQQVCEQVLFQETTTLGIRCCLQPRRILRREIHTVETPYGSVRIKIAFQGDQLTNVQPEYEDCAAIARTHQISWLEIHRTVLQSWRSCPSAREEIGELVD